VPFPFHYFSRSFSRWFNFTHFFAAIIIRWCSTATARTSREFNGLCGTRGVRSVCFIGRRPDPSWQQLWWGVIRFQNFRSLKLGLLFLHGFPCFKRINRVYIFDGFLWNLAKMFLGYQCGKGCEAFFDIPNDTCPFTRSRDKDRQLKNRFSQQEIGISKKPHTLL